MVHRIPGPSCHHSPVAGLSSKAASAELGRNVETLVAYHRGSGGQVAPELTTWLLNLDTKTIGRLKKIGLLPGEQFSAGKTMTDNVTDFAAALTAKGCTANHVELVKSRRKSDNWHRGQRIRRHHGNTGDGLPKRLRTGDKEKPGVSAQTFNFYLQAMKQFCRWAVKERRAVESPIAHLDGLNVKTDRRHDRRALTVNELRNLLTKTESGPERWSMTRPGEGIVVPSCRLKAVCDRMSAIVDTGIIRLAVESAYRDRGSGLLETTPR